MYPAPSSAASSRTSSDSPSSSTQVDVRPRIATAAVTVRADRVEVLAVDGDEDVDRDRLPSICIGHRDGCSVLAMLARDRRGRLALWKAKLRGVMAAGQDRPHDEQRLHDQDRLRRDHQGVRQRVAAVRFSREDRVGEHAEGGEQDQHHQGRRGLDLVASRVCAELSPSVPGAGRTRCSKSAVVMLFSFGGDRCPSAAKRRPEGRGLGVRAGGHGGVRLRERTRTGGAHRVPRTRVWIDPT